MRNQFTPRTPEQQALLIRVAKAALSRRGALEMGEWHTCETTHCIAGWAAYLTCPDAPDEARQMISTEFGRQLEGTSGVGRRLLGEEAASHFYDDNAPARRFLRNVLRKAGEPIPVPARTKAIGEEGAE